MLRWVLWPMELVASRISVNKNVLVIAYSHIDTGISSHIRQNRWSFVWCAYEFHVALPLDWPVSRMLRLFVWRSFSANKDCTETNSNNQIFFNNVIATGTYLNNSFGFFLFIELLVFDDASRTTFLVGISQSESSSVIILAADNLFLCVAPLVAAEATMVDCASSLTWNVAFGSVVWPFFGTTYVARGDSGWLSVSPDVVTNVASLCCDDGNSVSAWEQ